MEAGCVKKLKKVARALISRDIIALYLLAQKYKRSWLSLLTLYEIYGRDVFLFFYVMSGSADSYFMGRDAEHLDLEKPLCALPTDANLKLIFTRARKISDALRRNNDFGLTSTNLTVYKSLSDLCYTDETTGERFINFYSQIADEIQKAAEWTVEDENRLIEEIKEDAEKS